MIRGGVGLALLSAVAWGFWGICSKLSADRDIPPGEGRVMNGMPISATRTRILC